MITDPDFAKIWEKIILKPSVKEDLIGRIRAFNRADQTASRGLLLRGRPGTGKSLIGRHMGDLTGCYFMPLGNQDLMPPYTGQGAELVQKVWQQARARGRCVMFIDDCDWVFRSRGATHSNVASDELVHAFIAEWDRACTEGQRMWVVGAAERKELIDDEIILRIGAEIELGIPDRELRQQLFRLFLGEITDSFKEITKSFKVDATVANGDEMAAELAQCTNDIAGREIRRIVERAINEAVKRAVALGTVDNNIVLTREDLMREATRTTKTPQ